MNSLPNRIRRATGALTALAAAALLLPVASLLAAPASDNAGLNAVSCRPANTGIALPPGFCATVFADNIGHARHLVVAANGVVYVNTWSGRYYTDRGPLFNTFLVALKDTRGNGHADVVQRFGESVTQGSAGGTGIALYKSALYAEVNDRIVRYGLPADEIAPSASPDIVVSGMPLGGDHPMHPFVIDSGGRLFVDVASATNACQLRNRMQHEPGQNPCTELETRAGIWLYDANRTGQRFAPADRYATGLRNSEGLAFDATGRLYATQHGRDQLYQNWPKLYTPEQGAELPGEELVRLESGADYGWPECYFDGTLNKLVLAPEYGGDGGKAVGVCAKKRGPVAAFPAHWAPNDVLIYSGTQFPLAYRGGAFIAFHGSWNRAPAPQGGYNVVFQPMADGTASGNFVVFADGFAGAVKEPEGAAFRPTGLAMGPDGALYISDDRHGRIWRVTYAGASTASAVAAQAAPLATAAASPAVPLPDGMRLGASGKVSPLPIAPGATPAQVALGDRIFHGRASGGSCSGCHGSDGKGSALGSDLTSGKWLWGDGSLRAITATITSGVSKPKQRTGVMPPMGGAQLSPTDVAAVAAYVWAIGHSGER